jgi:hypothetical protein
MYLESKLPQLHLQGAMAQGAPPALDVVLHSSV